MGRRRDRSGPWRTRAQRQREARAWALSGRRAQCSSVSCYVVAECQLCLGPAPLCHGCLPTSLMMRGTRGQQGNFISKSLWLRTLGHSESPPSARPRGLQWRIRPVFGILFSSPFEDVRKRGPAVEFWSIVAAYLRPPTIREDRRTSGVSVDLPLCAAEDRRGPQLSGPLPSNPQFIGVFLPMRMKSRGELSRALRALDVVQAGLGLQLRERGRKSAVSVLSRMLISHGGSWAGVSASTH